MLRIAIDPGHGFSNVRGGVYDSGAVSHGVAEASVCLEVGLTGKWILTREYGFEIFMTRDDDSDPAPVSTRDDRALANDCDLMISLHCNAANGKASGTETFYRDAPDKELAKIVQAAAVKAWGLKDRGLKTEAGSQHARLAVLGFPRPGCLLEIGFIDHAGDRARMLDRDRRIAFWRALGEALTQ